MIYLRTPDSKEFEQVVSYIAEFDLDNRDLRLNQFTIAVLEGELVGFGRIREHADCSEICSLGTLTNYRKRGICKMLLQTLIKSAKKETYVVCIIPDYFKPFGFEIVDEVPDAILDKLNYCTNELLVPEKYFAMMKMA